LFVYKLVIAYDGTDFFGWQIQKDKRTVQGVIEQSLKRFFGNNYKFIGASRTDRGVHAEGQVASLFLPSPLNLSQERFRKALNATLPDDVYIKSIEPAHERFHARFSAKGKYYRYIISTRKNPFTRRYEWQIPFNLDTKHLKKLADFTKGTFNFQHLLLGDKNNSPIVTLFSTNVEKSGDKIMFHIIGDRFTYKLVRILVGEMVYNTRKNLQIKEYVNFLYRDKPKTFHIAPPNGLYLVSVFY